MLSDCNYSNKKFRIQFKRMKVTYGKPFEFNPWNSRKAYGWILGWQSFHSVYAIKFTKRYETLVKALESPTDNDLTIDVIKERVIQEQTRRIEKLVINES